MPKFAHLRAPAAAMDMAGVLKFMAEAKERELVLMAEAHSARERALQMELEASKRDLEAAKREAAVREAALRAEAVAAKREAALQAEA